MVRKIAERLGELDPVQSAVYEANATKYLQKLDAKIKEWKSGLEGRNVRFVFYHSAWVYFAEFFGAQPAGTIEPKPGLDPSPRHLETLIEAMKRDGVKLIVKENYVSDRFPKEVAAKTGARVVNVPIMVGGTQGSDIPAGWFWRPRNSRTGCWRNYPADSGNGCCWRARWPRAPTP